jgi:hypothetical protein
MIGFDPTLTDIEIEAIAQSAVWISFVVKSHRKIPPAIAFEILKVLKFSLL